MNLQFRETMHGIYRAKREEELIGTLIIEKGADGFNYAKVHIRLQEGLLTAKLFVADEFEVVEMSLFEYEDGNEITVYEKGAVVLCMKCEEGKVLTMMNSDEYAGKWMELFMREG